MPYILIYTLQHSTSETTPSQKYHVNMGMILRDCEAMDVSCCDIRGHVHASMHWCTETETYVAWHKNTVYEQILWSNHTQCVTKPKVVILNIYATKLYINIHLTVKLNYDCS
jgi:hypothetical protein